MPKTEGKVHMSLFTVCDNIYIQNMCFMYKYESHSEIFHVHVQLADRNHPELVIFSCINPLLCKNCVVKLKLFANVFQ